MPAGQVQPVWIAGSPRESADLPTADSASYRRAARRLRHRFRGDPGRLHRCLLALRDDADRRQEQRQGAGRAEPPAVLAREVAASLDDGLLRYSTRLALVRRAVQMGIGRFEANLIIATVQHRVRRDEVPRAVSRRRFDATALAVVLAVQGLIVLGACWIVCQ